MKPICFRAIRQQLLYNAHHSILQTHFLPVSRTLADHLLLPGWVCGGGGCLLLSSRRFPFSPPHRRCPPFPHSPCLVHLLIDSLEGKWMKCTRCGATSGFSSHDECCARPRSAPFLTIFLSKQLPTLSLSLSLPKSLITLTEPNRAGEGRVDWPRRDGSFAKARSRYTPLRTHKDSRHKKTKNKPNVTSKWDSPLYWTSNRSSTQLVFYIWKFTISCQTSGATDGGKQYTQRGTDSRRPWRDRVSCFSLLSFSGLQTRPARARNKRRIIKSSWILSFRSL